MTWNRVEPLQMNFARFDLSTRAGVDTATRSKLQRLYGVAGGGANRAGIILKLNKRLEMEDLGVSI